MYMEGKSCSYILGCAGLPLMKSHRLVALPEVWMNQGFTVQLSFRVPECFCKRSNYGHIGEGAESQLSAGGEG